MSLYVRRYGEFDLNTDIRYCKLLLRRLDKFISNIHLVVYKDYPNITQGKIIKKIPNALNLDYKVKDLVSGHDIFNCIFEFKFRLKIDTYVFDAYLRRNNLTFSKAYGQFELDLFGNREISNLGDLILSGAEELKKMIAIWIRSDSKQLNISIREAYICTSEGAPEIDLSKRIWLYYSNPVDFLRDIIKFIKNFQEIDAPKYVKEEYAKIEDKLRPYDDRFIAGELYSSNKFKPKFDDFVKENKIAMATGSLVLSSNDLESNFLFSREIAEKMVFPIMKKVPGRKEFLDIIKKEL